MLTPAPCLRPRGKAQQGGGLVAVLVQTGAYFVTVLLLARDHERPPSAQAYAACGLSWFDYYGGDLQVVAGSERQTRRGSMPHGELDSDYSSFIV